MKKFRTLFHVEHKKENIMTTKQWGDNYEKWLDELKHHYFFKWAVEKDEEERFALLTLFQFIKSLKENTMQKETLIQFLRFLDFDMESEQGKSILNIIKKTEFDLTNIILELTSHRLKSKPENVKAMYEKFKSIKSQNENVFNEIMKIRLHESENSNDNNSESERNS